MPAWAWSGQPALMNFPEKEVVKAAHKRDITARPYSPKC